MSYLEKNLTADFSKFLRNNPETLKQSCAIEFKVSKRNSLSLTKDLRPHQLPCLFKAQNQQLYHKLSDMSVNQKPFDAFFLSQAKAYLAVLFYKKRQPKNVYFMAINTVASLALASTKITQNQFKMFSDFSICL